jgi:hypothetical protein
MTQQRSKRSAPRGWLVGAWLSVACGGQEVVLGQASPTPFRFGPAKPVAELAADMRSDNPSLTADLREIYFSSSRTPTTSGDIWCAKRLDPSFPFDAPTPVSAVNTASFETSPAISADGLTLWFGSDRREEDHNSVWVSKRRSRTDEFGEPTEVSELGSAKNDVPRPLGAGGTIMPLSSQRMSPDWYVTYLAHFNADKGVFSTPTAVAELVFADRSTTDAFLTADGLALFFSSGGLLEPADLYVAFRKAQNQPFTVVQAIDDLNTASDERDPFLASDGSHFYFTSDRDGALAIFESALLSP